VNTNRFYYRLSQVCVYASLLFLLACAPTAVTPPPEGYLETMVAATVQALPTNTPYPTGTSTPRGTRPTATDIFTPTLAVSLTPFPTFTFTPTLTETPTEMGIAARQGVYQGSGNFACMVMDQKPVNWSKFAPGTLIYATWTVKNAGARDWEKNGLDIVYVNGERIYEYAPKQKLAFDVPAGQTRDIVIVVRAPKTGGDFRTTFGLQRSDNTFCQLIIGISVR
jgi:hypothetical protein